MQKPQFLYGASVQGIQDFIFKTNKLQEIVGASELVEQICTTIFWNAAKGNPENIILNAAGNIKYLFENEEKCNDFVRSFPKEVMEYVPGITISQAVVKIEENGKLTDSIDVLERRLKSQRNRQSSPFEIGFMGLERSRRTGGVAFQIAEHEEKEVSPSEKKYICEATALKIEAFKNSSNSFFKKLSGEKINITQLALDIEGITGSGENTWLAVVHADGNAIGILVQKLAESLKGKAEDKVKEAFATFSKNLDEATQSAAHKAFDEIMKKSGLQDKIDSGTEKYPIRPVILGGDDLTIIIRADLALTFTHEFLKEFEIQTKEKFKFLKTEFQVLGFENGITACAGIAYVKKSYPFHYAVHLAETLCSEAKKATKALENGESLIPKSNLLFYKVQDSFIEDWEALKSRTLNANGIDFLFGPYYIDEKLIGQPLVSDLMEKLKTLEKYSNDKTKSISKLRQWVSELFNDKARADFLFDRMTTINGDFLEELKLKNEVSPTKTIIYDLIQLHSLNYKKDDV